MDNLIKELFASKSGESAYNRILSVVMDYNMEPLFSSGVLIGLSGGADSVFLSLFISEYRRRCDKSFSVAALHVNHMIRGDDADRDEELSRRLCEALGFEFFSVRVDVPALSAEMHESIELTARNVRYSEFSKLIQGRKDLSCIVTAHNATDNVETVIFNLARGCGINGAGGIAPVRGNILRPLLALSKNEIVDLLDDYKVDYATDQTNFSCEYTRNYIRHEILPKLERINPRYENSFRSFSCSARLDNDFINEFVDEALGNVGNSASRDYLCSLHTAVLSRVLGAWCSSVIGRGLDSKLIEAIISLLPKDNFRLSIGEGFEFVCERGVCYFCKIDRDLSSDNYEQTLFPGENSMVGYRALITLVEKGKSSPIVYNNSIKADLSSAIINGELYVRFRREGDAYHYGGMTHKLKKVFNDLDILPSHRGLIPIICDDDGIVWVPGLGVRDDCPDRKGYQCSIVISRLSDGEGADIYFAHKETH